MTVTASDSRGAVVGDAIARLVSSLNTPDRGEQRAAADGLVEIYVGLLAENEQLRWELDLRSNINL
jgi:hypothetical protein